MGIAVSRALMELSLSLKPAEFEVQNIEFIEEELMENQRVDSRFAVFQSDHGDIIPVPHKYSTMTLKNKDSNS